MEEWIYILVICILLLIICIPICLHCGAIGIWFGENKVLRCLWCPCVSFLLACQECSKRRENYNPV